MYYFYDYIKKYKERKREKLYYKNDFTEMAEEQPKRKNL